MFQRVDGEMLCPQCVSEGKILTPIPAFGCSDGPGSSVNQKVFDRPDLAKELEIDLKAIDNAGGFTNEFQKTEALKMLNEAKEKPKCNIDYQKEGKHPLDSKNNFAMEE